MNTHNTIVQVHSVSRCAKVQHHTHTHSTHVRSTMGKPIPMRNPSSGMLQYAKVNYYTCTTHFGKPVGFPVPVQNLMDCQPMKVVAVIQAIQFSKLFC